MAETDVRFTNKSNKKIITGVIICIVILCAILIPIIITSQGNQSQRINTTASTSNPSSSSSLTKPLPTSQFLTNAPTCPSVQDIQRFDCFPDTAKATQNLCKARGCCWIPTNTPNAPSCFFPPQYKSFTAIEQNATFGKAFILTRHHKMIAHYSAPVHRLQLDIQYQTADRLRIKVSLLSCLILATV